MIIDRTATGTSKPYFASRSKDQEPGSRFVGESLAQLLNDPTARGMPRDIEVQYASPTMVDDEEAVEHAERDRGDGEEVHRRDYLTVIPQEGEPTFGPFRVSWCPADRIGINASPVGGITGKTYTLSGDSSVPEPPDELFASG